jgi:hypothetical protein
MGKKVQVPVMGGLRKVIQVPTTQNSGTTIQEFGSQVVSLAQLKAALGITNTKGTVVSGGSGAAASLIVGPGMSGGGVLTGAVNIGLLQPIAPVVWNEALLPDDWIGSGGSGGGTGGSSTLAGLSDVAISSPTTGQALEWNGTKWANTTLAGGGTTTVVLGNFTPDSHPASPDPNNDEFEGSTLSSQWTITNPSTKVFTTEQGYMHMVSLNDSVNTYVFEPLTNTTAFKYRAKCMMDLGASAFAFAGLCLYNSANGHNVIWGPGQNAAGRQGFYATALSGSYSSLGSETTLGSFNAFVYIEIEMDATNVYLRSSQTGEEGTFSTVVTQALSGNMGGATHIGFMFNGVASSFICDWIRRVDTGTVPATGNTVANPNITPDSHPATANAADDEFEFGTAIDTTGARFSGATPWTVQAASSVIASVATTVSQGALQTLTYTGSVTAGIGVSQPVPVGTWEYTAKVRTSALVVYNSTSWKDIYHGYAGSGASYVTQSETRNWSTGSYSLNSSLGSFSAGYTGAYIYLRIKFDGTNLITYYSQTGLTADWTQVVSQAASAWVVTATHIGLANSNGCMGLDWFRRTA